MIDTLPTNAIATLAYCTDPLSVKTVTDLNVITGRNAYLDGLDRYAYDGRLGFASTAGGITHDGFLATARCLAAPSTHAPCEADIHRARSILRAIHDTIHGPLRSCHTCTAIANDGQHHACAAITLLLNHTDNDPLGTEPTDPRAALSQLSLHLRARFLNAQFSGAFHERD